MKHVVKSLKVVTVVVLIMTILSTSFSIKAEAATVKLNKTTVYIQKGKSYPLKIQGTSSKVSWSSSNKKIATVSSSGKVKAISNGTVTVTAKVSGKSYKAIVKVIDSISKKDFRVELKDYPKEGSSTKFDVIADNKDEDSYVVWMRHTNEFTASRGIKNGSSVSDVEKAFGTTKQNKFTELIATEEEIMYHLFQENSVRLESWKYYMNYPYTYKDVNYVIRFYLNKDKKVNGMLLVKNIEAFGKITEQ